MKILHFLTSINTGGAEKFCVDICNTQADITDNEIYLCVLESLEEQPLIKKISPHVKLISLNKTGGYSFTIIYKIYKLLSKINPDCIHLNGRALIYASLPIFIKKIPSIYTVHTLAMKEYNKYILIYVKFLFNSFSSIFMPVAISKSVSKTVQNIYGKEFQTFIYNGSSKLTISPKVNDVKQYIEKLKKDDDTLVFIYIGRIAEEKNTLLLIDTFNTVLDNNHNVCLCIVGYDSTKEKKYMIQCENKNKYPQRIKFVGQKDNIADYLQCANASCITSIYEGLGISGLESFSMGVPVLSTPSGGPSEIIIAGLNGYVSEKVTVESYLEVILKFINKPIQNKVKIIDIYSDNYTMEACAMKYVKLYESKIM